MKPKFEVEFYYLSNNPGHCKSLTVIEDALRAINSEIAIQFRSVDLLASTSLKPQGLPGLPCLRRTLPTPERLVLVPSATPEHIYTVLGLPRTLVAEDQDQASPWTGLRS